MVQTELNGESNQGADEAPECPALSLYMGQWVNIGRTNHVLQCIDTNEAELEPGDWTWTP